VETGNVCATALPAGDVPNAGRHGSVLDVMHDHQSHSHLAHIVTERRVLAEIDLTCMDRSSNDLVEMEIQDRDVRKDNGTT
jgi:hypothetical protein